MVNSERLEQVQFTVHKFTSRPRPDKKNVVVLSCFSEFGCETLGVTYTVPRLKQYHSPDTYYIAVGWYGREYLYRHLVDEFWEIKEDHMWLREYARAFHHESTNLKLLEKKLAGFGKVISAGEMGHWAVGNSCLDCRHFWGDITKEPPCPKCSGSNVEWSVLGNVNRWKGRMTPLPQPAAEKVAWAKDFVYEGGPEAKLIGVTARNRQTYGRNLPAEYYVRLVEEIRKWGYQPVWLGEKQSTLACPVPDVKDFTRRPEARDLETTLALTSLCTFTIQYWTASTRLAAMVGVPYLLFESPDQIYGNGQEGIRMELLTRGTKKLAISHYLNTLNNPEGAIEVTTRCIRDMERGEWGDVIGLVESEPAVLSMMEGSKVRLGRM